jgi:hypothetical protein
MSIRYLIATALMASACAAHADVIPSTGGIVSGSNVAGAVGDSSVIAGVSRAAGSDALVQALYDKVSASVGSDMKVSLKQGIDGVYVTGLSTAKAVALAGDGMQVISTADGFKIIATTPVSGGGANQSTSAGASAPSSGLSTPSVSVPSTPSVSTGVDVGANTGAGTGTGNANLGVGEGTGLNDKIDPLPDVIVDNSPSAGNGTGTGNGQGNQATDAAAVPEPSTVALMLAGLLGVAGLGRRRAR